MKKHFSALLCMAALLTVFCLPVSAKTLDTAFATGASCTVSGSTISYTATLPEVPAGDDGMIHLYELKTYQYAIPAGAAPVASVPASANPAFSFALNRGQANTRLYSKFVLAVNKGGVPTMIANPQYINNPEAIATNTKGRAGAAAKATHDSGFTNVYLTGGGTVNTAGVHSVAQILNNGSNPTLVNPYAKMADSHPVPSVSSKLYMLNAADDAGVASLAADMVALAANSGAQDFIIGNEVNERIWNYMAWTDWDTYMREYAQAFRVCYTAIKSTNANANVYICLDQNWDRNRAPGHAEYYNYIDDKDFLEKFNGLIATGGNLNWNVALHPYPVPLTYAKFWDMSGCPDGGYMAAQVNGGKMITFQNMSLLTNTLAQPAYLNKNGAVRGVIMSEIGLSATQGTDVQAAAICAAYAAMQRNPYVSQFIYLSNLGDGVDSRLTGKALEVYNALGTPNEAAYMEWAKAYIGISDWGQILH
ncbi:MAG: DUF5722 domain-containing protein [Lachnospiraceae bacterium]|nr:DUF5722 domain-containing protein [Lachnospiraceae bacterium]